MKLDAAIAALAATGIGAAALAQAPAVAPHIDPALIEKAVMGLLSLAGAAAVARYAISQLQGDMKEVKAEFLRFRVVTDGVEDVAKSAAKDATEAMRRADRSLVLHDKLTEQREIDLEKRGRLQEQVDNIQRVLRPAPEESIDRMAKVLERLQRGT